MVESSPSDAVTSEVARSILHKNLRVKPGERVMIEAWPHTLPWAVALARETRRLKALPLVLYEDEAGFWDTVEHGGAKILGTSPGHEWAALSKTNVYIHMWGPGDRVRLNSLPPARTSELFRFNEGWYATARKAGLRGARLEIGRPFPALSEVYRFDQQAWTDQLIAATMVDPASLERKAAPIVRALQTGKKLRVVHPNGTDLTLGLARRRAGSYIGRPRTGDPKRPFDLLCNLPSGSVRVSLDEMVADGTLVGNRTSYYDDGMANGPTFRFSGGKLTEASFAEGGKRFDKGFQKGGPGRDRPGLFSIGLNPELHNTPQVEDVEAGAVMVAVGGNRYLGGKNRSPFFGWAVIAGSTVEVDGRPLALPG